MISLVLLYFVGKAFYDLAGRHGKGQWLFAILGVGSYYAGLFIGGLLIGIGYEVFIGSVDDVNQTLLGFVGLPFGVLACWGFYRILESSWENKESTTTFTSEDILDSNLIDKKSDEH